MSQENQSGKASIKAHIIAVLIATVLVPMLAFVASPGRAEAASVSTLSQYRSWIADAKAMYPYPQSADKMYRTMMCESTGQANIVGGTRNGYYGLFQYAPSTWRGNWNPYRNNSLFDAKSQIYATAKAWSIGMQNQWSCYFITAGR